ncbi:MAG: hypothetical protein L3J26_09060 [Candidatus Polarisedimenticolaceae bacterium]|nr:hypothetical protein [Candidatus Polarisedimenticolaceae bacterium]
MYIRRTQIKSRQQGEPYYTYRLVESERVNGQVKQRTLLNLGRHFDLPKAHWHDLASRIEQLLSAALGNIIAYRDVGKAREQERKLCPYGLPRE